MAVTHPGALIHGNNAGTVVPLKVAADGTLATSGGGGSGGTVAIDQTTPGTTNAVQLTAGAAVIGHVIVDSDASVAAAALPTGAGTAAAAGRVTLASDDPAVATLGATTGTKVITDATGTLQQYLRGLIYLLITSGQALVTASLAAGSNLIGKVGIDQTTPGTTNLVAAGQNGTWTVQPGNTANTTAWKVDGSAVTQPVSIASLPSGAVTNAGTFAVQPKGSSATNVAIADNPVNLGVQAVSSENTAVTTARQVQLVADLVGKLIVLPYSNPENFVSGAITSAMTGTTSTSLLAAPAAGLRNYITSITVSSGSITVPTDILIQDGSGGTTLYVLPCPIGTGTGTGTSGATFVFPTPLRQPTTATAIFCANVTTGSSTKVSASGYKGA